jgi:hypothetical protein
MILSENSFALFASLTFGSGSCSNGAVEVQGRTPWNFDNAAVQM